MAEFTARFEGNIHFSGTKTFVANTADEAMRKVEAFEQDIQSGRADAHSMKTFVVGRVEDITCDSMTDDKGREQIGEQDEQS